MAIIDITDLDGEGPTLTQDERGHKTYTTRHLVTVDAPMTQPQLLIDPAMPVPHVTTLGYDEEATCRTRALKPWEDLYTWFLTIKWSTEQLEEEESDPLAQVVSGGLRCVDVEEPCFYDVKGQPAVTTAGDLYSGLTKVGNNEIVPVTYRSTLWPIGLKAYNNTVNANTVELFGELYAPRTLWMKNLVLPEDYSESFNQKYWETRFEIHHDRKGFGRLLPNAGLHELQYYTRAEDAESDSGFTDWSPVDFDTYEAESNDDLKKVERKRIKDHTGQDVAQDVWLNKYGEATVPTFSDGVIGTASMNTRPDPSVVTLSASVLTASHEGSMLTLQQTPNTPLKDGNKSFHITKVLGPTSCKIDGATKERFSGVPVVLAGAGALFNYLEIQSEADWSKLPLPGAKPDFTEAS